MTSLEKEATLGAVAIEDKTSSAFKRRFMIRMIIVLTGGTFLDGYILGIVGPVSGQMTAELGISPVWEGLIAAAALFGILVGSPLGGWAGDKFGRKPLFMLDMGLFVIASAMQFFIGSTQFLTTSPLQLFVVRLLMGIAIGAEYSVGWPMLSEFSPSRIRGRLMGLTLIAWYAGFMIAFVVGYLLNRYTDLGWRNILGTSTFIAVALFLGRLGMPESPRWLWSKRRTHQARSVAHRYMESASDMADVEQEAVHTGGFGMLFSRQYWRATLFVSLFFLRRHTVFRHRHVRRQRAAEIWPRRRARRRRRTVRGCFGRECGHGPADRQGRPACADRTATVDHHRDPRNSRLVDRCARDGRAGPVPRVLVLQRRLRHADVHLPRRGIPDRDPRDRNGLRRRLQPDRGGPRHVPDALVHDQSRPLGDHFDRRRHRRYRCWRVAMASPRNQGQEPQRNGLRVFALAPTGVFCKAWFGTAGNFQKNGLFFRMQWERRPSLEGRRSLIANRQAPLDDLRYKGCAPLHCTLSYRIRRLDGVASH